MFVNVCNLQHKIGGSRGGVQLLELARLRVLLLFARLGQLEVRLQLIQLHVEQAQQ